MLLARVEARIEDKLRHSTQLVHDVDMEQVRGGSASVVYYIMYTYINRSKESCGPSQSRLIRPHPSQSCTLPIVTPSHTSLFPTPVRCGGQDRLDPDVLRTDVLVV